MDATAVGDFVGSDSGGGGEIGFYRMWRYVGKCQLMRDLAIECSFEGFCRKRCRDATKFGKLLSRPVGLQNRPRPGGVEVWPPRESFARNLTLRVKNA